MFLRFLLKSRMLRWPCPSDMEQRKAVLLGLRWSPVGLCGTLLPQEWATFSTHKTGRLQLVPRQRFSGGLHQGVIDIFHNTNIEVKLRLWVKNTTYTSRDMHIFSLQPHKLRAVHICSLHTTTYAFKLRDLCHTVNTSHTTNINHIHQYYHPKPILQSRTPKTCNDHLMTSTPFLWATSWLPLWPYPPTPMKILSSYHHSIIIDIMASSHMIMGRHVFSP